MIRMAGVFHAPGRAETRLLKREPFANSHILDHRQSYRGSARSGIGPPVKGPSAKPFAGTSGVTRYM
jgi:hypothetical protein